MDTSAKKCADVIITDAIGKVFDQFPDNAILRAGVYRIIAQGFEEVACDLEMNLKQLAS